MNKILLNKGRPDNFPIIDELSDNLLKSYSNFLKNGMYTLNGEIPLVLHTLNSNGIYFNIASNLQYITNYRSKVKQERNYETLTPCITFFSDYMHFAQIIINKGKFNSEEKKRLSDILQEISDVFRDLIELKNLNIKDLWESDKFIFYYNDAAEESGGKVFAKYEDLENIEAKFLDCACNSLRDFAQVMVITDQFIKLDNK